MEGPLNQGENEHIHWTSLAGGLNPSYKIERKALEPVEHQLTFNLKIQEAVRTGLGCINRHYIHTKLNITPMIYLKDKWQRGILIWYLLSLNDMKVS